MRSLTVFGIATLHSALFQSALLSKVRTSKGNKADGAIEYKIMIKNLCKRFGSLTLWTVFTVMGMNTVEQRLADDNGREAWHSEHAVAQTAEERIARQVYQKARTAVDISKN